VPKNGTVVLISYLNSYGKSRVIIARYIEKFTEEAGENWDDFGEYNEETDSYYWPDGWYEKIDNWDEYSDIKVSSNITLTGWQPLPKPPES